MTVLAAPPEDGTVNLSLHLGATYDELVLAGRDPDRLLVVEVNPNLPRTCSLPPDYTNLLPLDIIDVLVEASGAPFTLPRPHRTSIDEAIADVARSFVADGATLQIGIGAVPNMVASKLADGPGGGYGVHSEMFTDGLMLLHRPGRSPTTPSDCSTGCRSPRSPWGPPSSTAGSTATATWPSSPSRWSTTRR